MGLCGLISPLVIQSGLGIRETAHSPTPMYSTHGYSDHLPPTIILIHPRYGLLYFSSLSTLHTNILSAFMHLRTILTLPGFSFSIFTLLFSHSPLSLSFPLQNIGMDLFAWTSVCIIIIFSWFSSPLLSFDLFEDVPSLLSVLYLHLPPFVTFI